MKATDTKTAEEILKEHGNWDIKSGMAEWHYQCILRAMEEYRSQPLPEQTERELDREPKTELQKEFGRDFVNSVGYFSTDYVEWLESKYASHPSEVSDEEVLEPIQNALYATNAFSTDDCTGLAEGILTYLKDAGFSITHKQQ